MKNTLQKVAPEWHAEAVEILKENFTSIHESFLDSTKKAVWLGMFLNFVKQRGKEDKSIPHGEFLPWLEKNYPDAPARTCNTYMALASGVCEKGKFEIRQFSGFAHCGDLPKSVEAIVEGKTQSQLFLEFKQTRDGEKPSRGRLPGEGGKPGRPTSNITDMINFDLKASLSKMGKVDHELGKLGCDFIAQPDDILTAWLSTLERSARCAREWLNTPPAKRDSKIITKLWRTL